MDSCNGCEIASRHSSHLLLYFIDSIYSMAYFILAKTIADNKIFRRTSKTGFQFFDIKCLSANNYHGMFTRKRKLPANNSRKSSKQSFLICFIYPPPPLERKPLALAMGSIRIKFNTKEKNISCIMYTTQKSKHGNIYFYNPTCYNLVIRNLHE